MSSSQNETDLDALRDHFGREMCRLRQRAALSRNQLAAALGCTPQWLYTLEKTDKTVPEQMAFDLDTYFKTEGWENDDGLFHRIYGAIRRAGQHRVMRPSFESYVQYEAKAISVRCFATQVVPGLLQTEGYARGVMDPNEPLDIQEARVVGRMERQAILTREKPPMLMFIIDESVLRRPIGGAKVMVDQIDHLIGMTESPCVQVRIMLFERITSVALGGGFILLSFEKDADLIYAESGRLSQLLEDRDTVFKAGVDFDTLMGEALSQAESIELLRRTREVYL
ncbi:helix-turn-helix domain-containing protein [Actinoallomurus sp. CA-150999]|uniref:helix-turn-helix domain-containing protein n=1 Tax=Actinoallomurus sp. CA-150999 TaxID=3239887 RepID=UPI003D905909